MNSPYYFSYRCDTFILFHGKAMLGETETEIKKRIEDYKEKGVIKGTSTIIDRSKLQNAGVNAIIEIKVTPKAETGFDETAKIVASFDNVDSVYLAASATCWKPSCGTAAGSIKISTP